MNVPTTVTRSWTSYCWGRIDKGPEVRGIGSFTEKVTQHDLTQVGKYTFWRGGRITPAFSKRKKDVEDVRKTI